MVIQVSESILNGIIQLQNYLQRVSNGGREHGGLQNLVCGGACGVLPRKGKISS